MSGANGSNPTPFTPDDPSFSALVTEANSSGYGFVERFQKRWLSGDFRFDQLGEKLLAIHAGQKIVAFGGLCFDPYSEQPNDGRIRHLYVLKAWRGNNFGHILLNALTQQPHPFTKIRLRTDDAGAYYERIGWIKTTAENATHELSV